MQIDSVSRTHIGLVRANNQDALLDRPETGLFLVADGMGGEQAGDEASALTVATISQVLEEFFASAPSAPAPLRAVLSEALQGANRAVLGVGERDPIKRGMGSTASLLCLRRGVYFIAHVGDSRVYLARAGRVQLLTRDHTVVWTLYEHGSLRRDQLETHPERHLLTQCIGSPRPIELDVVEGTLAPGDLFLICSDGLHGYVPEDKISQILLAGRASLAVRAKRLIDEALRAGGGDNVTVLLAQVGSLAAEDDWQAASPPPPNRSALEATATGLGNPAGSANAKPPRPKGLRPGLVLGLLALLAGGIALALRLIR